MTDKELKEFYSRYSDYYVRFEIYGCESELTLKDLIRLTKINLKDEDEIN